MNKEWSCKKCRRSNDPQRDEFSIWRCYHCDELQYPWLIWGFVGLLALLLIIVIWKFTGGGGPEKEFVNLVKTAFKGDSNNEEGELTEKEYEYLGNKAEWWKISEKTDQLIDQAKREYLEENKHNPQLCQIANNMGMSEHIPGCSQFIAKIRDFLEEGEFSKAYELVLKIPPENLEGQKIRDEIETPTKMKVRYQYQRNGQEASDFYPIDSPEIQNIILTSKDRYRLAFSSSQDDVTPCVYIFQRNHSGEIKQLFPDTLTSNPIEIGYTYSIPPQENEWLDLNDKSIETGLNVKTLYVIASPWEAKDIEQTFDKINEASEKLNHELIDDFVQTLFKRKNKTVKAIYYVEYNLNHSIHILEGKEWWHIGYGEYGYTYQDAQDILKDNKDGWALPSLDDMKTIDSRESTTDSGVPDILQNTPYWTDDTSQSGKPYGYCFGSVGNCSEVYPSPFKDFHEGDALSIIFVRKAR